MKTNLDVAKEVVISYFESMSNKDMLNHNGFQELFNIKFDETNKILLEHIKALRNIFDGAIREIEGDNNVKD